MSLAQVSDDAIKQMSVLSMEPEDIKTLLHSVEVHSALLPALLRTSRIAFQG